MRSHESDWGGRARVSGFPRRGDIANVHPPIVHTYPHLQICTYLHLSTPYLLYLHGPRGGERMGRSIAESALSSSISLLIQDAE